MTKNTELTFAQDNAGRPIVWALLNSGSGDPAITVHSTQALAQAALKRDRDEYLAKYPDAADAAVVDTADKFEHMPSKWASASLEIKVVSVDKAA